MIVQHPQPTDGAQIYFATLPTTAAPLQLFFYIPPQAAELSLTCRDAQTHAARLGSQLAFQCSVTLCWGNIYLQVKVAYTWHAAVTLGVARTGCDRLLLCTTSNLSTHPKSSCWPSQPPTASQEQQQQQLRLVWLHQLDRSQTRAWAKCQEGHRVKEAYKTRARENIAPRPWPSARTHLVGLLFFFAATKANWRSNLRRDLKWLTKILLERFKRQLRLSRLSQQGAGLRYQTRP